MDVDKDDHEEWQSFKVSLQRKILWEVGQRKLPRGQHMLKQSQFFNIFQTNLCLNFVREVEVSLILHSHSKSLCVWQVQTALHRTSTQPVRPSCSWTLQCSTVLIILGITGDHLGHQNCWASSGWTPPQHGLLLTARWWTTIILSALHHWNLGDLRGPEGTWGDLRGPEGTWGDLRTCRWFHFLEVYMVNWCHDFKVLTYLQHHWLEECLQSLQRSIVFNRSHALSFQTACDLLALLTLGSIVWMANWTITDKPMFETNTNCPWKLHQSPTSQWNPGI